MKHTPGKWEIDTTLHEDDPVTIIETTHGRLIAEVEEWNDGGNARLISAAPDLLESAEYFDYAANLQYSDLNQFDDGHIISFNVTVKALKDNKEAISKAQGK